MSELAKAKLIFLTKYLVEEWNQSAKDRFIKKLTNKINQISKYPDSCPKSEYFPNLFKCVVTKQTSFYYRILWDEKEIEIITIFDSRQDPLKEKTEPIV